MRESGIEQAPEWGPAAPDMMALSAFAAIDEAPWSGESTAQQEEAILADLRLALGQQLGSTGWAPIWVGVSGDNAANLVFVAKNQTHPNQCAVIVRGTDFSMTEDLKEDFEVKTTVPFTVGEQTVQIAEGTSVAHNLIIEATGSGGTTLLGQLRQLVGDHGSGTTIFVTGHSLGGALATTVASYLQNELPDADYQVYTFAAPTVGLENFVQLFDSNFGGNGPGSNSSWRVYNGWDVIPQAWQGESLQSILSWYPSPPGPAQNREVRLMLEKLIKLPGSNGYQQPNVNVCVLNNPSWTDALKDTGAESATTADFEAQIAFQHDCNTYLQLLGAPTVAMVAGLTPNAMSPGKPQTVKISGLGFTPDCTVTFANPGITVGSVVCESPNQLQVTITIAANATTGPCDVTVSTSTDPIPGGTQSFYVQNQTSTAP